MPQGAAVRVACLLWSWLVVLLQGAGSRYCSQSGMCALELACWCHRRMPLKGAVPGFFSEAAGGVV